MKINTSRKLIGLDDQPLHDEAQAELTIGKIMLIAVLNIGVDKLGLKDKLERYDLAQKLTKAQKPTNPSEVELETEELTLIKKLIGDGFPSPVTVGAACDIIEGRQAAASEPAKDPKQA